MLASTIRDPFEEGRALWWRYPLDRELLDALRRGGRRQARLHRLHPDPDRATSLFERNVDACAWDEERPDLLAMRIEAPAFMRNQVRVLVGTMLEVGGGRRPLDDFAELLGGAPRERAGETALAHGLYLVGVGY